MVPTCLPLVLQMVSFDLVLLLLTQVLNLLLSEMTFFIPATNDLPDIKYEESKLLPHIHNYIYVNIDIYM